MTDPSKPAGVGIERLVISVAATAAVTCVAILVVLMMQTNKARLQLQQDGVAEFNFVLQLEHNLDLLAMAALQHDLAEVTGPEPSLTRPLEQGAELIKRFDILYSIVLTARGRSWAQGFLIEAGAPEYLKRLRQFVAEFDTVIQPGQQVSSAQLTAISVRSQALSNAVYDIGIAMFQSKSVLRDEISSRLDWLINASWFFGVSFILAMLTLYFLLVRASGRAGELFQQSRSSQRQLKTALEELTTGDSQRKAQNRFLAAATHDLRQPLQAMQYYLAALEAHVPGERGRQILGNAGRSTDAAQSLLTGLLDISKLDAGVLEINLEEVDLDTLLTRLHHDFLAEATDRGLLLKVESRGFWVHTDPQALERILRNLIGNALTYTESGSVNLSVHEDGDGTVLVAVEDTGVGIPEHEQEAIFNEYYQIGSPEDGRAGAAGMGLGLSIVRRLTRLLEVSLEVESTEGEGTRFTLRLPRISGGEVTPPAGHVQRAASQDRLARLDIMIIDDEPAVRDGVSVLLQQKGCRVTAVSSVDEAREIVIQHDSIPDLLLADYQLQQGRTGLEAIETVRDEINEDVPAILITGDTSPGALDAARSAGLALLHKPVGASELFAAIDVCLQAGAGLPHAGMVSTPANEEPLIK